jgi:hypothetical protein
MDHDPRCCARVDTPDTGSSDAGPTDAGPAEIDAARTDGLAGAPGGSPAAARADLSPESSPDELPTDLTVEDAERIDWVEAQTELDRCDGYVVLAVDPQTGEVDAHGPFPGLDATEIADEMRENLDREGLDDVVIRVVRWHQDRTDDTAA